jgi:4'-phosphopantetheinyl transferase
VHLWWTWLNLPERAIGELGRILSQDERERATRFIRARDRRQFVVARGTLRIILARYLGCPPVQVLFRYEPLGKPRLARSDFGADLEFNVAHSRDLAVYAVSRGPRVGVDVERVRPLPDLPDVARTAFSRREQARLFALPCGQRLTGFFACWTRKEAYLKGRGDGLLVPSNTFDVSLAPDEPAALLGNQSDPQDVDRWSIIAFAPAEGYIGAVAVEAPRLRLIVKRWVPAEPA